MSKGFHFYSEEEKALLQKFVDVPKFTQKTPEEHAEIKKFCKKYNRTTGSVLNYISSERARREKLQKSAPTSVQKADTSVKKQALSTLRRNEFVIPVNNWELQTVDGQVNLVLKFK